MNILITFLTLVLVLNCLVLMLLVLIQLPKKEAGAGLAFGGGATDALFGAGSGNALTKLTKTFAATFLGLSLVIGFMNIHMVHSSKDEVRRLLALQKTAPKAAEATPAKAPSQFQTLSTTNLLTPGAITGTNAPATTNASPVVGSATNPPAPPAAATTPLAPN